MLLAMLQQHSPPPTQHAARRSPSSFLPILEGGKSLTTSTEIPVTIPVTIHTWRCRPARSCTHRRGMAGMDRGCADGNNSCHLARSPVWTSTAKPVRGHRPGQWRASAQSRAIASTKFDTNTAPHHPKQRSDPLNTSKKSAVKNLRERAKPGMIGFLPDLMPGFARSRFSRRSFLIGVYNATELFWRVCVRW